MSQNVLELGTIAFCIFCTLYNSSYRIGMYMIVFHNILHRKSQTGMDLRDEDLIILEIMGQKGVHAFS